MNSKNVKKISIPIRNSKEVVELSSNELPEDVSLILKLLKDEVAPLEIWLEIALEYYKQGKEECFEHILKEATDTERVERLYYDQQDGRIKTLNSLAGFYIEKAKSNVLDNEQKEEYYSKANQLIKAAEMTNKLHPATFVTRGVMYLNQGEYQRAISLFETALTSDSQNIPAILGRACILYNQKNYKEALELYQKALEIGGSQSPPAIRLGIGLCHYSLGNFEMAKFAFKRVIDMEENANALVALAILELNSPPDPNSNTNPIEKAMKLFARAFNKDPTNPMTLNHLANHFFYNNQMDKAQKLASSAYKNSQVNEVKAESCYHMARLSHVTGNYEAAFSYYYRIVMHLWPDFVLGRFGLGQMYLQRNELDKALDEFLHVLKEEPDNFETNKIIGSIYAEKGKYGDALPYFLKANSVNPNDEQVLIEISKFQHHDPQAALEALLKAKNIMEKKKQPFPYEFYNNLGALYHRMGNMKEAYNNIMKALKEADIDLEEAMTMDIPSKHLTLLFNAARILQACNMSEQARKLFLNILRNHIGYYECYLSLALISHEEGNDAQAIAFLHTASKLFPDEPVAFCAMGYIYLNQHPPNYNLAQKQFEYVLQNVDRKDGTALVALGTIYFNSATASKNIEINKSERYLQYASDYFERALKYDNCNMYAALSLGAVIAQRGYLDQAKEIFTKVQESCAQSAKLGAGIAETWINLANVNMCQKKYLNATKLYQKVSKTFYKHTNIPTLHCLAASYYDGRKLTQCKTTVQQALALNPSDISLWYDLAVVHHEICATILDSEKLTVEQAEKALEDVNTAQKLFNYIAHQESTKLTPKAKGYVEHCDKTRKEAIEKLGYAKEQKKKAEKEEREKREAQERHLRELQRQKEEEERKKREEEEMYKKIVQEMEEKNRQLQEKWSASKMHKKELEPAEENEEFAAGTGKKRKRKSKKAKEEEAAKSDSEGSVAKKKKGSRLKKNKDGKKLKKKKRVSEDEQDEELDLDREKSSDNVLIAEVNDESYKKKEPAEEEARQEESNPSKVRTEGEEEFQFE